MSKAEQIIKKLGLEPLPSEGGFFKQTYRSESTKTPMVSIATVRPDTFPNRAAATAIYYMVTPLEFSALHRLRSDEIYHFYSGDPVEMIQIDELGSLTRITMGPDVLNDQIPQVVVRRGVWQATRLKAGGSWALLGTTMAPGFEFDEFELGEREDLIHAFPHLVEEIKMFSREVGEAR